MKLLLLIGANPNHTAFAARIQAEYPDADVHVVVEKRVSTQKRSLKQLFSKVLEKLLVSKVDQAWFQLMEHYRQPQFALQEKNIHRVSDVNSEEVYELVKQIAPDLVIVSGTSLIRKKLLSLQPPKGIVNLHTGLSPYIKGGPNCTNWCIATGQWHLVGNTIMWIDAGIDTGTIITTARVDLKGKASLFEIHLEVMQQAHELYAKAIALIAAGEKVPNVPQDTIAKGTTYYNKAWKLKTKM